VTQATEILVSGIKIANRARADLGDLGALAESIKARGLLNPIIVDQELFLICGHRRVEAVRSLGMETIEARIVDTANDTLDALLMESDENELRKPFTPSEAIAMKKMIEGKFKAEAKARQISGLNGVAEKPRSGEISGTEKGDTRDKIAKAIGIGCSFTMRQAQKVVDNGIPELVSAMDSGEVSVNAAGKIATLPTEEQKAAIEGGKEGMKEAARKATKPRKKKEQKQEKPPEAVPVDQAPQMSALVMRVRIMSALDYMIADDPNSIRVLTEVAARVSAMIEKFTAKGNLK
jgi:ParB-like chromosome segregation protein Spo0J